MILSLLALPFVVGSAALPDAVPPASPPVLAPLDGGEAIKTAAEWERRQVPVITRLAQSEVYGTWPEATARVERMRVSEDGRKLEYRVRIEEIGRSFDIAATLPRGEGPFPAAIQIAFCGNRAAMAEDAFFAEPIAGVVGFCTQIRERQPEGEDPFMLAMPVEALNEAGIAAVSVHPSDIIPDNAEDALPLLEEWSGEGPARLGTIAAWGKVASLARQVLDGDDRFDPARTAVIGHSRNGKAAFAAMLFDPEIDLLWAHQSGTGGATLNRSSEGEAVENITGAFPHWFAPRYRDYAGAEDQLALDTHHMIGAMAPRPVLLGGGDEDTWAGPYGAYAAALGADPVYELYGTAGLDQPTAETENAEAPLAVFIREGTHGTKKSDWERFIAFSTAQWTE